MFVTFGMRDANPIMRVDATRIHGTASRKAIAFPAEPTSPAPLQQDRRLDKVERARHPNGDLGSSSDLGSHQYGAPLYDVAQDGTHAAMISCGLLSTIGRG